ncbi:MAG TPA: ABC transporter ATP-binding protein [Bryobacteraceae bacterium]|nr:ABC transporter ATP-binding protein [Bryobacteraceae bacterium]
MAPLVEFQNVSKWFPHTTGRALLRTHITRWLDPSRKDHFVALKNVSFRLEPGESMAVIGSNGAGKSTLLSLAAGLAVPNEGKITVNGRVAALLELGSGFHPDLTGAENLILNAALLGLSRKQTMELSEKIVEFSGIGDFINEPLRTYSSGMVMRLAFSIAINTDPDIMMLDEVLAVGDSTFQQKCHDAIEGFQRSGKSLLFVSHAAAQVREMCEKAIWLDHGELMMEGDAAAVLDAYSGGLAEKQQAGRHRI